MFDLSSRRLTGELIRRHNQARASERVSISVTRATVTTPLRVYKSGSVNLSAAVEWPAGNLAPTCSIPLWATRSIGPLNEVFAIYEQPDIVDTDQAIPFTGAALTDAKIIRAVRPPIGSIVA
jgi:hypothetical protein